jgi:hypothetical protein
MKNRRTSLLVASFLLLITAAVYAGGWAIITVNDFPDYGVAGKSVTVTFSVRQHGVTLTDGLKPVAFVRTPGQRSLKIDAQSTKRTGEYRFDLQFTEPGDWTISIDSGFLFQMIKEVPNDNPKSPQAGFVTIPLRVIPADSVPPVISARQHGENLFNLKGCAGCHGTGIGPTLIENASTAKHLVPEYVKRVLADPEATFKYQERQYGQMPNLNLKTEEIAALTEFLINR